MSATYQGDAAVCFSKPQRIGNRRVDIIDLETWVVIDDFPCG